MQQLDLFGNPIATQPTKAEEKKAVAAVVEQLQAENKKAPVVKEATPVEKVEAPVEKKDVEKIAVENASSTSGKRGRKSFKDMDADIVMVDVPEDEILFQKQYYSISEVAKWFHVNQSLIRFWENEFAILKPRKTRKGDRLFRPEDVKNIQLIYHLLRQRKFSIEGARQYLKDNKKKADAQMQIIQSLTKLRAFLLEWKANLGE
jgi:DNA-binding transcriptional MerR regulator